MAAWINISLTRIERGLYRSEGGSESDQGSDEVTQLFARMETLTGISRVHLWAAWTLLFSLSILTFPNGTEVPCILIGFVYPLLTSCAGVMGNTTTTKKQLTPNDDQDDDDNNVSTKRMMGTRIELSKNGVTKNGHKKMRTLMRLPRFRWWFLISVIMMTEIWWPDVHHIRLSWWRGMKTFLALWHFLLFAYWAACGRRRRRMIFTLRDV